MKRKSLSLYNPAIIEGQYEIESDGTKILLPIKLSDEEKAKRLVDVAGFKFFDTGYALACPECGRTSGISCREDIDKQIDFFLKFGCEHYTANTGEALLDESE